MRQYYRRIIFSKTPLRSQFRYEDKFQIFPIKSENAPNSPYSSHFPLFLEYYIDFDDNQFPKGVDIIKDLTAQQVVEFEIVNLLSVLSNHRFFKYIVDNNHWAISTPNMDYENLTPDQQKNLDNQTSSWMIASYMYPGLKEDLEIKGLSDFTFPETKLITPYMSYFLQDPVDNKQKEITFPESISFCLDNYFVLTPKTLRKVKSSIALICDGIDLSETKRSLSFLSYVSAIEAFAGLEFSDKAVEFECHSCHTISSSPYLCQDCGKPIWGIKTKFKEFLRMFVTGSKRSLETYNKIYNLRSKIAHQGQLFISDYEFSLENIEQKEDDYIMRLQTLQLARISLTNWLRYEKKACR